MSIFDTMHSAILTRRALCTGAAVLGVSLMAGVPVRAAGSGATKAASWIIGSNLGFAALLYAQGAEPASVEGFLSKAKSVASTQEIGIEIKPFPEKGASMPDTMASVIYYLIQGDGWNVGDQLIQKFDDDHGRLFEVAVKSSLLLVLYQPGDDSGIGEIVKSRCEAIGLPPELWKPVTDAVAAKNDPEIVRDAVLKMHQDMSGYLINS